MEEQEGLKSCIIIPLCLSLPLPPLVFCPSITRTLELLVATAGAPDGAFRRRHGKAAGGALFLVGWSRLVWGGNAVEVQGSEVRDPPKTTVSVPGGDSSSVNWTAVVGCRCCAKFFVQELKEKFVTDLMACEVLWGSHPLTDALVVAVVCGGGGRSKDWRPLVDIFDQLPSSPQLPWSLCHFRDALRGKGANRGV